MHSTPHTNSPASSSKSMHALEVPKIYGDRRAALPLNIAIVGCGLGGLAVAFTLAQAGHHITVFEGAPALAEVGAGIQIGPNLSRLLIRWGLGPQLQEIAVIPEALRLVRYKTGETLGWTRWGDSIAKEAGSPYYHIHRADFLDLLVNLSTPFMNLRLNSRVTTVDPTLPSLTLHTGETVRADLIVGADGVKSLLRSIVLNLPANQSDEATPTGDAAYRAIVPASALLKDPELAPLVHNPEMTGWIGPKKHIMGYCIRGKREYNIVMLHPDEETDLKESWTAAASTEKMRKDFHGWEPRIQKLLALVPSTLNWKLMDRKPLKTWVHDGGRVVLLGDACHPMLPYRAQGSAMAIEDAAVLGNLFSRISHIDQIHPLLLAYQELRYDRATATQESSRLNQHIFHLEDGPEQEERDKDMRTAMKAELEGRSGVEDTKGNPNQWADKSKSKVQFGYDADAEVERWWKEVGERKVGKLGNPMSARL